MDSRFRDCRKSPKRGFDELSLSGSGSDFKRLLPLTLSLSKGVFDFSDSLFRGNDEPVRWTVIVEHTSPNL
jgi:hypothetical protein